MLKIDDLKFFVCPLSFITPRSWEMLALVNDTTDVETGQPLHLPFPGAWTEQPEWYREAVRIKRNERNSDWYQEAYRDKIKRDMG